MGRKGMKSFFKGVHKPGPEDETAEAAADQPTPTKSAASPEQQPIPKATETAKPTEAAGKANHDHALDGDSDDDDEGGSKGPETRGKMLQRHKREMAAHKKAVQKLGSKKKDEAARLTADIESRHARELAELEQREKQAAAAAEVAVAGATEQLAGLGVGDGRTGDQHKPDSSPQKPSKAQKRREKLAQQDAEREARIAAELAALGPTDKAVEEEQLRALLQPLKLSIREIRADGHCMYRAVEDQLVQQAAAPAPEASAPPSSTRPADYLALRRLAASYIRSHADDFLPFVYDEDVAGSPEEQLEGYCSELEGSAVWGGQLELGALAQALQRQIKVYALGMPPVTLGDEHAAAGVLQLCYLRHAFGLGEHYNSVVPLGGVGVGLGDQSDE